MNVHPHYRIFVSGNAPRLYPADTYFGLLYYGRDEALTIPKLYPYSGEWGQILSTQILENDVWPIPRVIYMVWLSIVEQKFYMLRDRLQYERLKYLWSQKDENLGGELYSHIVVGMAPYGGVAVWVAGDRKSVLEGWHHAEITKVNVTDFMDGNSKLTLKSYCDSYIEGDPIVKMNLIGKGLPPPNLFEKYMQQFTYRYLPLYEKWNEVKEVNWKKYEEDELQPEFEYIEESLFDGTFDKLHNDGLLKYHQAGKPKKLAIKWHIKKSEYTAYFWFEDEKICSIFERFYGAHPETKTDFIIRIDAEKKKYELALFRQGLKEPQIIPEDAYQLLVFKNKFEHYRSDNYNQERGAWIW